MTPRISVLAIALVIANLHYATAHKWISIEPGVPMPENSFLLSEGKYVGRATHLNLVLPAEVYNSSYAVISVNKNIVVKQKFQVLEAEQKCEWKFVPQFQTEPLDENVLHVGSSWNGEPIFIGKQMDCYGNYHIIENLFSSGRKNYWSDVQCFQGEQLILFCHDDSIWVEATSDSIPMDAISGGKSFEDLEIFVARLLAPSTYVSGQVIPALNITTAVYGRHQLEAFESQVLVGELNKYSWKSSKFGEIPDYAVVAGQSENNEFRYVARQLRTLGYIEHLDAFNKAMVYDILVKNVD